MNKVIVCILDYGSGNVKSVFNMLNYLGIKAIISNSIDDIKNCSHLILPGVGAFGAAMHKITKKIPIEIVEMEVIEKGKPFLGICVGMQVLADYGFEFGSYNGLGWIPGEVKKLETKQLPLPHIGWNNIQIVKESEIFFNFQEFRDFYFVHSFVFDVKNEDHVLAETEYDNIFNSIVRKDNIFGVQFHPEKSQRAGQLILKNFVNKI